MIIDSKRISHIDEIYRPYYRGFLKLIAIVAILQALSMTLPVFYGKIIDSFIKVRPVESQVRFSCYLLGILILKIYFDKKHGDVHIGDIAFGVEKRVAHVTLEKISKLSLGQISNSNSGFKNHIIKNGESALREAVEMFIFDVSSVSIRLAIAIGSLFWLNAVLGSITLASISLFAAASLLINKRILPQLRTQNKLGTKLGTFHSEIIKHLRMVIVFNQEERALNEHSRQYDEYGASGKRIWFSYFNQVACFREPFAVLGQFSVLMAGIYLVNSHRVTPGSLVMAMAWSMTAFQATNNIGTIQRRMARYSVHIGRYFDLLDIKPAVAETEHPIRPPKFFGRIEFKSVSFEYPMFTGSEDELDTAKARRRRIEENHAIRDVSFTIEPGETCAFVGHSGAGKSTVINLILRGYDPDKGQILIDGNDLRLLDLGAWRSSIGCVEQDPKLWDQSLAYNMKYGRKESDPDVSLEELDELARKTQISEFYDRLGEDGFDTELGENGIQLSGGQRQRVAIARAIIKSPSVVILDEATNALDTVNEEKVHRAIDEALEGRTGIIIAHRLSTIRNADRIIVFDKGRIVGNGKHADLMQTCEAYQALVARAASALNN